MEWRRGRVRSGVVVGSVAPAAGAKAEVEMKEAVATVAEEVREAAVTAAVEGKEEAATERAATKVVGAKVEVEAAGGGQAASR